MSNLFATLADHLSHQDENYLTQTLAAVFNESRIFRRELGLELKARLGRDVDFEHSFLKTQVGKWLKGRRIILDGLVVDYMGRELIAFENKLESGEGPGQFKKYRALLQCPLVVVCKYLDPAPKDANLNLNWTDLYLIAERCLWHLRKAGHERFFLEDWMTFLSSKGVVAPDPIRKQAWRRVMQVAKLMAGEGERHSILDDPSRALGELRTILARLELHRDGHCR